MKATLPPVEVSLYTVAETALLLGVHVQTVYRWLDDGTLSECTTRGGSIRLVDAEAAEKLKRDREVTAAHQGRAGSAR